ncbi:MAG: hypothetical protein BBJ57_00695 [Desulfobacterales bacterium PC51MH44]|nr:MAG: hypothetical protein BBJ57_00695 [Desulfobacterales bacterium PC51MH44]
MMKYKRVTVAVLATFLLVIIGSRAWAQEPVRPAVDGVFDPQKEARIESLVARFLPDCFEQFKQVDFFVNKPYLYKGIFTAFNQRRDQSIGYAVNILRRPVKEMIDGKLITRGKDLYIAKKVFEVFPDESTDMLLTAYKGGDPITKGNIILASGNVVGILIRSLLIDALNDKTTCQDIHVEMVGDPLRICDVAYNQLVLRYKIKNVLRTIGTVHRIKIRDYHISILKKIL